MRFNFHRSRTELNKFPQIDEPLPILPSNRLKWIHDVRPIVEGKPRTFLATPFWIPVYNDYHPEIMIVNGRQTFKSTYATDLLLIDTTDEHGVQVCYVNHDEPALSAFMTQKLRVGAILQNPILQRYPRHGTGSIGEISLRNNSTIYGVTDHHEYKHVEGKSLKRLILDEAQYQDIQFLPIALEATKMTHGTVSVLGVGGESGSAYHNQWLSSDQREWEYDNEFWREGLEFNSEGLVIGEYMEDLLKGMWTPAKPDNTYIHGYHMPQTIFPQIPLTIDDAIHKYNVRPSLSIEWQERNVPKSLFESHVMGWFYKALRRPVTREMILRCMDKHYRLLTLSEIAQMKDIYENQIRVAMGVDFGSGPSASYTVISILIKFAKSGRYFLAYIERRQQENQMAQARHIADSFRVANCDIGIGDLGYGQNQVKIIQDGGDDPDTAQHYEGVGSDKFFGCRTTGATYLKSAQFHQEVSDEHGDTVSRFTIDGTTEIQNIVDTVDSYITHPLHPTNKKLRKPKLLIPYYYDYETEYLIEDFTDITRKDLKVIQDVKVTDPRQTPRKEFNHPRDSVASIVLAKVAVDKDTSWYWVSA